MRVTVHTERGTFQSSNNDLTPDQAEEFKKFLNQVGEDGTRLTLGTENGYVVICGALLKTAAIVVEE